MRSSLACLGLCAAALCNGPYRQSQPQDATTAVLRAFDTHNIVMFGEQHACKQEYGWLRQLVSTQAFADRVDDIVVEMGNSLYQKSMDRYIAGEDIPLAQVQQAWRNMIGLVGPPSPVLKSFYETVRETNLKRCGKHQMRIVLGDPYGDWAAIKTPEDWGPFAGNRDSWYARVVKEEVLDKNRRALLVMGANHFLRKADWGPGAPTPIEQQLRAAGAHTYFIVFGTNAIGDYDSTHGLFQPSWIFEEVG
ncbi:MAG TPA: hypothetical protein VGG72_22410 [Bryobacteraceae bacterium]|jgi:hypothetical protein